MQINKQDANVGKAVFSGEIKSGADGSIIVPDKKPDILKILQVDAESSLEEKIVENGKLIIKGNVYVNILYIPDTDDRFVQSIKGVFDFCETIKNPDFEHGMDVTAFCDTSRVGYKLINSRKVGIDAHILIDACVTSEEIISFVSDIESECSEKISDTISVKVGNLNKEFTFEIEDRIDLPCSCDAEILKTNSAIKDSEIKAITGKIVAKGRINTSILYVTEKGDYEHLDLDFPFTEVFEWDDAEEDKDYEVIFEIIESEFKFNEEDEERKVLVCFKIRAIFKRENFQNLECITDCYFTDSDCEFEFDDMNCEEICDNPTISAIIKQPITKDENSPGISRVYTIQAKPYITSTDILNDRITVSGKISVCALYISNDDASPLSGISEEIPFMQSVDCKNISDDAEILLGIVCEHISCTLNNSDCLEVRCGILIKGKIMRKTKIKIIKDIILKELPLQEKAVIVYFAKNNDTLWDIGKRYHVKCEDIRLCNVLESDSFSEGQKILIPISK